MSYSRAAKKTTFSNYTCLTDITPIFLKWSGSKERSLCRKLRVCFPISLLQISNCCKISKGVCSFVHETCCAKMKMKVLLANSTQHSSDWRNLQFCTYNLEFAFHSKVYLAISTTFTEQLLLSPCAHG